MEKVKGLGRSGSQGTPKMQILEEGGQGRGEIKSISNVWGSALSTFLPSFRTGSRDSAERARDSGTLGR